MNQPPGQEIRIALLEDDPNARQRFVQALQWDLGLLLKATFGRLGQALQWLKNEPVDVFLVDLSLPDGSGLDAIRYCRQVQPNADIMVVTIHDDAETIGNAIRAGATGYLLKSMDVSEIGQKIRELRNGGAPMSPSIARYVLRQFQDSPQEKSTKEGGQAGDAFRIEEPLEMACEDPLTRREKTILVRMSEGFSYREIAQLETVSVHTVHAHIKKIYIKLNVHSRAEAVFEAMHTGLLTFR